jgi:ribonuclease HII
MLELDGLYSGYGFASHKGYPTPEHCRALKDLGALPIHRRSFARVRQALGLDPIQPELFPTETDLAAEMTIEADIAAEMAAETDLGIAIVTETDLTVEIAAEIAQSNTA